MNRDRISEVGSLVGDINSKLAEQKSMLARVEALCRTADGLFMEGSGAQCQAHQNGKSNGREPLFNQEMRRLTSVLLPPGATVAIISKGDDSLLQMEDRTGWHFPQDPDGTYVGYHPGNSAEAIIYLEQLRRKGAGYLLIPSTSFWWLDFYTEFREYLTLRYRLVAYQEDACAIFALDEGADRTYLLDVRCHGIPRVTPKPQIPVQNNQPGAGDRAVPSKPPANKAPNLPARQILPAGTDERQPLESPEDRPSKRLNEKLRGGFSRSAVADLRALKSDPSQPPRERAEAAYSLARSHAAQGQFEVALREIQDMRTLRPDSARHRRQFMLEALFLCRLGRAQEARTLLQERLSGFDPSAQLMLANTWNPTVTGERTPEAEARVLEHINAVYRHFGLSTIEKRNAAAPLSLDNLRGAPSGSHHFDPDGKVTVIVPIYNAAGTITTALTSLAEQTWENLEVLVVDDASTDDTAEVVSKFCRLDQRFRLICQEQNGGSYLARNRALAEATGVFVTIHDADDWSHPERISRHVDHLRNDPLPFNVSDWARASTDLCFWGTAGPYHKIVFQNMASLFFPRTLMDIAGPWDQARVSADHEFIKRVQRILEVDRPTPVLPECPLAIGRSAETSLTQQSLTHVSTLHHGIRREYQEAADLWHSTIRPGEARSRGLQRKPPYFPIPASIKPDRSSPPLDVLFIADWNLAGGAVESALNMVRAARRTGLSCGLLHYRSYHFDVTRPLKRSIRRFAWDNDIRIVAPGEALEAHNVIVTYPAILDHAMDRFPQVKHQRVVVVVNQMAERDTAGSSIAYDPQRVRQHLREFFGHEGHWVPISNWVRRLLAEDRRYPLPRLDVWTPMIDVDSWLSSPLRWRGGQREWPVVGRHGRDHLLKWPGTPDALRAAYCAELPCETRFLGGARHAESLLSHWPSNWIDEPYGTRDVREFLADLDFFVHYPHEDYIEEFGRAPMEAMAAGIPVILPPVFQETFGDAALYAEPEGVWPTIEALWRDRNAYLARARAGRDFVLANCGWDQFPPRLERLAQLENPEGGIAIPTTALSASH
jgi:hypothetical protein